MSDPKPTYPYLPQIPDLSTKQAVRLIYDRLAVLEQQIVNVDAAARFTSTVAGGGHRVTDIADPVGLQDAVTKRYLQVMLAGQIAAGVVAPSPVPAPTPTPTPSPYPSPSPGGNTSGDNHVFTEAGGKFHAFGATLFWSLWGFRNDRERLAQNLRFLADRGCQYVRVLGCVGGASWSDRLVDPGMDPVSHQPSVAYRADVEAFTDWVCINFRMRTHWTIFGGSPYTPTLADRANLITMFGEAAAGRGEEFFVIEVANEAWQNDFPGAGGLAELRNLTAQLQAQTDVLVAATSGQNGDCAGGYGSAAIYGGGIGDVVTWHLDRDQTGTCLLWRPVRQPYDLISCTGPALHMDDEPIGPQSSVAADDDPLRLAMTAAVGYAMGCGAYTLHTGAGVRGGGWADVALGRAANVWEVANIDAILQTQRNVRDKIPNDAGNWAKFNTNVGFPERPFDFDPLTADTDGAICRLYGSWDGNEFVATPIGIGSACGITCRDTASHHAGIANLQFWDPLSNTLVLETTLGIGASVAFPNGYAAFILRGTWN